MKKEIAKTNINVNNNNVSVIRIGDVDYISLTDLARYKNPIEPKDVVKNWLRAKTNIEFLALWEKMNNPNVKGVEIDTFKNEAGTHYFTMSPQRWIKETNAIGIVSKSGNNGGTYAHPDIAFEFASWISPEFSLYLIKEFERLKKNEGYQNKIEWSVRRELAKTNYRIHTDSIKSNIIPILTEKQKQYVYANEADILNVALFGMTAKEWKDKNPNLNGNMRDYANVLQLVILSNLENINAELIKQQLTQKERLIRLNEIAKDQFRILDNNNGIKRIEGLENQVYSYENLGYESDFMDGLYFDLSQNGDASVVDSTGEMAVSYPGDISKYPQETPVGAKCTGAQACIGLMNTSDTITMTIKKYDGNSNSQSVKCNLKVD